MIGLTYRPESGNNDQSDWTGHTGRLTASEQDRKRIAA
jgi:hypothetical protein